jgi:hypothetical protein
VFRVTTIKYVLIMREKMTVSQFEMGGGQASVPQASQF